MENNKNQNIWTHAVIVFPEEKSFDIVEKTRLRNIDNNKCTGEILTNGEVFKVEIYAKGSKNYCETKADQYKRLVSGSETDKENISFSPSIKRKAFGASVIFAFY